MTRSRQTKKCKKKEGIQYNDSLLLVKLDFFASNKYTLHFDFTRAVVKEHKIGICTDVQSTLSVRDAK